MKLSLIVLGLLPIVGAFKAQENSPQQQTAVEATGPTQQLRSYLVLSPEDDAVLHASCFLTGLFTGGEDGQTLVGDRHRVVSIASYVTVAEAWQPSMCHSVMTVNADGMEEVLMVAAYQAGERRSYEISVTPANGLTWGGVADVRDLIFVKRDK